MHAASELVRSRSLKTCRKSTFSDIQPHFYRHTSRWARSALPCPLLSPQSLSPLSSLHISSTFFILLSAPEDVFSSPLKKKSTPSKCNPGGCFTFCLTPYPISCSLNLWTLNIIHLLTPTHTWWLRADSFTKMFPFPLSSIMLETFPLAMCYKDDCRSQGPTAKIKSLWTKTLLSYLRKWQWGHCVTDQVEILWIS